MARGSQVPSYGNWGSEDGFANKEIFGKARKGQSNMLEGVDVNYLEEDHVKSKVTEAAGMMRDQRMSEDGMDFKRRDLGSPAGFDNHTRPTKLSMGSEFSIEKSPWHRHARTPGRGSSSPMTDGRATRDLIHGTPGRARLSSASQGDDHDRCVTVPKFGEWDDGDPNSAEGFTEVFNNVRLERQGIESSGTNPPANNSGAVRNAGASGSKGGCCGCCPWLGI